MKCLVVWMVVWLPVAGLCLDRQLHVAEFEKADSIAVTYANHSLSNLDLLASGLTRALHSDEAKFRAIYKWVCDNISYDRRIYLENKRMRAKLMDEALDAWNARIALRMFRELVLHRRTVCTGYAWLVKELAVRAGLTCVVVDGYGRNVSSNIGGTGIPNHSWNAVRLSNHWYLCDATWSAGAFDAASGIFIPRFNDAYFLADPELFVRNHYPLDAKWTLLARTPSLPWFLNAPLVYSASLRYNVRPVGLEKFEISVSRGDSLTITISADDVPTERATLHVGSDILMAREGAIRTGGSKELMFTYRFRNRGLFAVHVMINADWVLTYKVSVI